MHWFGLIAQGLGGASGRFAFFYLFIVIINISSVLVVICVIIVLVIIFVIIIILLYVCYYYHYYFILGNEIGRDMEERMRQSFEKEKNFYNDINDERSSW